MKDGLFAQLFSQCDEKFGGGTGKRIANSDLPYADWLKRYFPNVCTHPLAERHTRLWEWFDNLEPGSRPRPRVDIWPRGGAKSSTGELGTARVGAKLTRRFVLYVSGTQEQADKHVQSIASLFESLGVERAINKYGSSRGWRRDQLRTENGFNVAGLGLDVAARGIKLDQYRPDLIIFDDVDDLLDSLRTVDKKKSLITNSILPAGSSDCAVLYLQNKIHEDSIASQLCDGRADFLLDRETPFVDPAIVGMEVEAVENEDGSKGYKIVSGVPTWAGQDIPICEAQIARFGLKSFKRESQHEVEGADGYFFLVSKLNSILPQDVPPLTGVCLGGDLAATEGGGDHTALWLLGKAANNTYYVLAVIRGQWSADRVRAAIKLATQYYRAKYSRMVLRLPQDGGQAGKSQAQDFQKQRDTLGTTHIVSVTGSKSTRAEGMAEQINLGNYYLVKENLPDFLRMGTAETDGRALCQELGYEHWHAILKEELRKFREDEKDQVDDQVDAGADAHNELAGKRRGTAA